LASSRAGACLLGTQTILQNRLVRVFRRALAPTGEARSGSANSTCRGTAAADRPACGAAPAWTVRGLTASGVPTPCRFTPWGDTPCGAPPVTRDPAEAPTALSTTTPQQAMSHRMLRRGPRGPGETGRGIVIVHLVPR
jgi:hypothetical protein